MFVHFLSLSFVVLCFNQYCIISVDAGISADKCVEYEDYAFEVKSYTTLMTDSVVQKYKVLDCYRGTGLISGGVAANIHEFPHFALLGYKINENEISFNCGGSLISERFILSAAHCKTYDYSVDVSVVRLGEHNLTDTSSSTRKDYDVEQFIAHERYSSVRRINDIALIKLTTDVTFSTKIRPACLHQNHIVRLMGSSVVAIGFGKTGYARDASEVLLKVTLSVINPNLCKKWVLTKLMSSQICIQGAGEADTCHGDSGGPIQQNRGNCTYELMAITSYGSACSYGTGAVYTRISSYIPWIENIVWK